MAACAGAEVLPVDVGIAADMTGTGILDRKIAWGTRDFLKEPAMTRKEAVKALEVGIEQPVSYMKKAVIWLVQEKWALEIPPLPAL